MNNNSSNNNNVMSDSDYIQSTDLGFFMKNWLQQLSNIKPDNIAEHGAKYFKHIRSCQHVLGTEYSFIISCRYNRRAFVFCIMEALMTIPLDEQYTITEFQLILDMLCLDMPKHILIDASNYIDPNNGTNKENARYLHKDLRLALFLYIIYEEWIHYVDTFFRDEKSIHTTRLKNFIDQLRINHAYNIEHPPIEALDSVYTNILKSHKEDISDFFKALLQNPIMIEDLCKFPSFAKSLSCVSDSIPATTKIEIDDENN